jgi:hypothetical protein
VVLVRPLLLVIVLLVVVEVHEMLMVEIVIMVVGEELEEVEVMVVVVLMAVVGLVMSLGLLNLAVMEEQMAQQELLAVFLVEEVGPHLLVIQEQVGRESVG